MNKLILAFAIILLTAGEAVAVDLINRDSRDYDVRISFGGSSSFIFIGGRSSKSDVCPSSCTISLGDNHITAKGSDRVIVENGRLSKE